MSTKIAYTTRPGEYAREYVADVANLHINLDKCAPDYLGWCIFIVEFDGPNHVESDLVKVVYHTYDQTLKEAKARAQAFVEAHLILQRAV
jgi:hypothetical protein